jgi:hypothetical protein
VTAEASTPAGIVTLATDGRESGDARAPIHRVTASHRLARLRAIASAINAGGDIETVLDRVLLVIWRGEPRPRGGIMASTGRVGFQKWLRATTQTARAWTATAVGAGHTARCRECRGQGRRWSSLMRRDPPSSQATRRTRGRGATGPGHCRAAGHPCLHPALSAAEPGRAARTGPERFGNPLPALARRQTDCIGSPQPSAEFWEGTRPSLLSMR